MSEQTEPRQVASTFGEGVRLIAPELMLIFAFTQEGETVVPDGDPIPLLMEQSVALVIHRWVEQAGFTQDELDDLYDDACRDLNERLGKMLEEREAAVEAAAE